MKNLFLYVSVVIFTLVFFVECKTLTAAITDKQWNLTEVQGSKVTLTSAPFLVIASEQTRISGNAGCNSFFGNYQMADKGKIAFSGVAMTRKFCVDSIANVVENQFSNIFEKVENYKANEKELTFTDKNGVVLAKFKLAEKQISE
ncbi:MAG: META domain-containing protein [Paludibacter sp.]|jgi:heat shock protein HslJ|nr:META domain-containing protein [Paludibacter sp.]